MSITDFDYDNEPTNPGEQERDEAWYAAMMDELQADTTIVYADEVASSSASDQDLREAAIGEAAMIVSLNRRGESINDETAAIAVLPDHVAVCFSKGGKRYNLRMTVGDLLILKPESLFSLDVN